MGRMGREPTDDVDSHAFPSGAVVLVREFQVVVVAGQLLHRRDPAKTPRGVSPVKFGWGSISLFEVSARKNGLSDRTADLKDTVLFDRRDVRIGTQIVQVIVRELSGVPVDEAVFVRDVARGGRDAGLDRANVGSKRHALLEGDDVLARDRIFGLRDCEKGGHRVELL